MTLAVNELHFDSPLVGRIIKEDRFFGSDK